jgi:flagellar biogenesis protein FliO
MGFFKQLIDFITVGSDRPILRLVAYYTALAVVVAVLFHFSPIVHDAFSGDRMEQLKQSPQLLQDGMSSGQTKVVLAVREPPLEVALSTLLSMLGTLALMLPVSWVYMSAQRTRTYNQSVVQTLIILPIVVAGVIMIVRNSLALAFSLAGVVSAVRFRTTLKDSRDVVFIFLAIAVGFAAGVQTLAIGAMASVVFNFLVILIWRYDFGRNVLEPTASSHWTGPLTDLALKRGVAKVPDRDLVLALTPNQVNTLAQRFKRVRNVLGDDDKKPRYNAILSITTNSLSETQQLLRVALDKVAKRWKLDDVVTNAGKPSELYYLVKTRKSATRDEFLTAIRTTAGDSIVSADLEISDPTPLEKRAIEKKERAEE